MPKSVITRFVIIAIVAISQEVNLWKVKAQNNAEKKGINTCNAGIWLIKVINYPLAELLHFPR